MEEEDDCGFYSNAVRILEDSDEEPPIKCVKYEIKNETLNSDQINFAKKGSKKQKEGFEDVNPPIVTRRQTGRKRLARHNNRGNPVNTSEGEIRMLNIIEINDSPTHLPSGNTERGTDSPVEELRQLSDLSDIVSLDDSISLDVDEMEVEVAIHVKWRGKSIEAFHLKKSDALRCIFEHFAKVEGVSENRVLLTHNGRPVHAHDLSEKFQSGVIILDGSLKKKEEQEEQQQQQKNTDPNQIELNILRKDKREKLSISMARADTMEVFMAKTANVLNVARDRLQFMFDGEKINADDTPDSLDLEGGECVEVIVRP